MELLAPFLGRMPIGCKQVCGHFFQSCSQQSSPVRVIIVPFEIKQSVYLEIFWWKPSNLGVLFLLRGTVWSLLQMVAYSPALQSMHRAAVNPRARVPLLLSNRKIFSGAVKVLTVPTWISKTVSSVLSASTPFCRCRFYILPLFGGVERHYNRSLNLRLNPYSMWTELWPQPACDFLAVCDSTAMKFRQVPYVLILVQRRGLSCCPWDTSESFFRSWPFHSPLSNLWFFWATNIFFSLVEDEIYLATIRTASGRIQPAKEEVHTSRGHFCKTTWNWFAMESSVGRA